MKKKCKHIDITDWQTVLPWVKGCILRHKKRYDFKSLLLRYGCSESDYHTAITTFDYSVFDDTIKRISIDACNHIKSRNLELPPVRIQEKMDKTTGKIRDIGKESAMQQIYDHIAVYSCQDIFNSRMVDQQMSSIKGRGQIAGIKLIKKYITADNRAMAYAKRHNLRYTSKCKYAVKLDIEKCYASADVDIFMRVFEHDCGNQDIIWLWRTLLESHRVDGNTGFMIGALPSQWACQVLISFIYRKAMTLKYEKRKKQRKKISHMVLFMDDMLLFGSNRKQLLSAVRELTRYTKEEIGLTIKPNFMIHKLDDVGIDMMGFVIYRNGKVEMRERNFIKSRRLMLRFLRTGKLVYSQAQRLNSYKGFYKYSDSRKISKVLSVWKIFNLCSLVISKHDKENNHAKNLLLRGTAENLVPSAV